MNSSSSSSELVMRRSSCREAPRRCPGCAGRRSGGDRRREGRREHLSRAKQPQIRLERERDSFFKSEQASWVDLVLTPSSFSANPLSPRPLRRPLSLSFWCRSLITLSLSPCFSLCLSCLSKNAKPKNKRRKKRSRCPPCLSSDQNCFSENAGQSHDPRAQSRYLSFNLSLSLPGVFN